MRRAGQKAGGQREKSKRKGRGGQKRAKGKGPKVLPVRSAAGDGPRFVVEEPQDTVRRLKSTGHGRLKPIMLVEDPEKSPTDDGVGGAAGFLDETVKDGVLFPDAPKGMATDLDYDEISFGETLGESSAQLIEDMPEEKWDFGAKEAQFGTHRGWARKGTDDEFAVVDGEWDDIMKKVDAGIGDDDLNINDKIEEYLRDTGGLTSGIGVDLPVAEINNLIRQFSSQKKAAIFQECEQATEDTEAPMSGLRVDSTGPGRNLPIVGHEGETSLSAVSSPQPPLSPRHSDFGIHRRPDEAPYNNRSMRQAAHEAPPASERPSHASHRPRQTQKVEHTKNMGWQGPPPGCVVVTEEQITALRRNINNAHQRRTRVLKKQLMANKKFIQQLQNKLGDVTERLIEHQVRAASGYTGSNNNFAAVNEEGLNGRVTKARHLDSIRREGIKRSLLAGLVDAADEYNRGDITVFDSDNELGKDFCARCYRRTNIWIEDHLPLTHDVRSIEARYGQNVASFFHFMRYVIFCFFWLSLCNIATYAWHVTELTQSDQDLDGNWIMRQRAQRTEGGCEKVKQGEIDSSLGDMTREEVVECEFRFVNVQPQWEYESKGFRYISDNFWRLSQFSAFPRKFGFSRPDDDNLSSFAYALNMFVCAFLLAIMGLAKLVREDKQFKVVHSNDGGETQEFVRLAMDAWDHGITDFGEAWDRKSSTTQLFHTESHRAQIEEEIRSRSRNTRAKIYSKRLVGVFLSGLIQVAGWYLLYNLIDRKNGAFKDLFEAYPDSAEIAVPLTISVLNSALPTIIWMIVVKIEKWDDKKTEMKQITLRVFVAKVLNVLLSVFACALLYDPRLMKHTKFFSPEMQESQTCAGTIEDSLRDQLKETPKAPVASVYKDESFCVGKDNKAEKGTDFLDLCEDCDYYECESKCENKGGCNMFAFEVLSSDSSDLDGRCYQVIQSECEGGLSLGEIELDGKTGTYHIYKFSDLCVMDMIADILSRLLILNFVIGKFMALAHPAVKYAKYLAKKRKGKWKKEFWVPFYIVNLVYSVTLSVVCSPFYPLTFLLGFVLLVLEFKFTKLRLQYLMYKPLVPFSAKDVGLFYLRFYLVVIFFGVLWTHWFLAHESFCRILEFGASTTAVTTEDYAHDVNNLYLRAHKDESLAKTCVGFENNDWVPALRAEVISAHLGAPLSTCHDCVRQSKLGSQSTAAGEQQTAIDEILGASNDSTGESTGTQDEIDIDSIFRRQLRHERLSLRDRNLQENDEVAPWYPEDPSSCRCTKVSDIWNAWNSNRTLPLRIRLLNVTNTSMEPFEKNIKPGCSPFIAYNNGYEAITSQMNAEWKGYFDDMVAKPSSLTLASTIAVGLLLLYMYRGNTMLAHRVASEQIELRLRTECDGLRMRNKAINHQLELRRRQQAAMLK
eukprot:g4956.t1